MLDLLPAFDQQFVDNNGVPLAGGFLYTYLAGTTTPQATYTDASGVTPNTNPIVLNGSGRCTSWVNTGTFKFVLTDSLGDVLLTVDNWQALNTRIASQINVAGALAVINNLSDVQSVFSSLQNLNIAPYSYPTKFTFTNGQSATSLTGEIFSSLTYSSVVYEFEVTQGTTIFANGSFFLQYKNTVWQLVLGDYVGDVHGLTFSLSVVGIAATLQIAEGGLGNGTLKLKKHYFFT